jgi:hypothetical protein
MESPSATLYRLMRRRVPPEKRQRTEMSCDWCRKKRCKCLRMSTTESCRACNELKQQCSTTEPRKRRMYPNLPARIAPGPAAVFHPETTSIRAPPPPVSQPTSSVMTRMPPTPSRSVLPATTPHLADTGTRPMAHRPKRSHKEHLFEDSKGFPRYIGPIGSYTLLVKLWEVMALKCAAMTHSRDNAQTMGQSNLLLGASESNINLPPREVADALVDLFFERVHCDFPIFHRALFQEAYEGMWSYHPDTEAAWLMSLSMVFVLGLEAASQSSTRVPGLRNKDELRKQYLSKTQDLLLEVISGSMLSNVQALMLYCRYLHITRNRDACWNITGSAIRVAIAIGLHRNGVHTKCSPLERELRKRIWWTLYAFERMECSSLGRTSAIDDDECNVGIPTEGLLDMGDTTPLGYVDALSELMKILGSICKHQYGLEELSRDQIEFAVMTSNILESWYSRLPSHLRLESYSPKSHLRGIYLLHIQYHYTVTLLYRPFLLSLATKPQPPDQRNTTASSPYAKRGVASAKAAVSILDQLFRAGLFNSKTCWDVYFIEAICMILAMGRLADDNELKNDDAILKSLSTCVHILRECKEFSPTMQRFAVVTTDFAQALVSDSPPAGSAQEPPVPQRDDDSDENSVATTIASQAGSADGFYMPVNSNYANGPYGTGDLHNQFVTPWNFAEVPQFWDWDESQYRVQP